VIPAKIAQAEMRLRWMKAYEYALNKYSERWHRLDRAWRRVVSRELPKEEKRCS
jgi:hypothetical protein